MGLYLHEPCTTTTDQHKSLRIGRYCELTRYAAQIVLYCWDVAVVYLVYANFFGVGSYGIEWFICQPDRHWSKMSRDDFSPRWEYSIDTAIDERCSI